MLITYISLHQLSVCLPVLTLCVLTIIPIATSHLSLQLEFWMSEKSLMAKWLEQASQWHEMYCHDLEVMS